MPLDIQQGIILLIPRIESLLAQVHYNNPNIKDILYDIILSISVLSNSVISYADVHDFDYRDDEDDKILFNLTQLYNDFFDNDDTKEKYYIESVAFMRHLLRKIHNGMQTDDINTILTANMQLSLIGEVGYDQIYRLEYVMKKRD